MTFRKHIFWSLFAGGLLAAQLAIAAPPVARKEATDETFFDINIGESYRWMEDATTQPLDDFIRGQALYARNTLNKIPGLAPLLQEIRALDVAPPSDVRNAKIVNGKYYFRRADAGSGIFSLVTRDLATGEEHVVVDIATVNKGGKRFSVDSFQPSNNGRYVAYTLDDSDERQYILHIVDTETGKGFRETIPRTDVPSITWRSDNRSFYYSRLQDPPDGAVPTDKFSYARAYLHILGNKSDVDLAVVGVDVNKGLPVDPADYPVVLTAPDSPVALAVLKQSGLKELVIYTATQDAARDSLVHWTKVADRTDGVIGYALHQNELYLLSRKGAPHGKVLRLDGLSPSLAAAKLVVPESKAVIADLAAAADGLYLSDLNGGPNRLRVASYGAAAETITLPFDAAVTGLSANPQEKGALFTLEGWVNSPGIDRYDPEKKAVSDTKLQPASPVDTSSLMSTEEQVTSADGAVIPLSIIRRKDAKLDGSNPALLEAYGAFGESLPPKFAPSLFAVQQHHGIYAICHVRGGGEYGEEWHLAGLKLTKPNSWNDLLACAQYLIAKNYTTPAKFGLRGNYAGGIAIGRAMTEKPELFHVVLDQAGLSNTLRSEFSDVGATYVPEFGSISNEAGFKALQAMDVVSHIKDKTAYPAALIGTPFADPRMPPWHSAKLAARLQDASSSGRPVLLTLNDKADADLDLADELAFFFWQIGLPAFQPAAAK